MKTKKIPLEGKHPYTGQPIATYIEVIDELPGPKVAEGLDHAGDRRNPDCWTPLAGPFRLDTQGGIFAPDRQPLLGLYWDLSGQPIANGSGRRPSAQWHLVEDTPGVLMVYRKATEMLDGYDVAYHEEAESVFP